MTYSDYHIHFPLWSHIPKQTLELFLYTVCTTLIEFNVLQWIILLLYYSTGKSEMVTILKKVSKARVKAGLYLNRKRLM